MSLTVKFYHNGETRRFPFEPPKSGPVFAALVEKIRSLEPDLDLTKTSLHWKDDEGDYIVMKTDGDVQEALKHAMSGLFKVYAMEKNGSLPPPSRSDSVSSVFGGPVPMPMGGIAMPPFVFGGPVPPIPVAPAGATAGPTAFQMPDLPGLPKEVSEKIRKGVQAASEHHALYQAQLQKCFDQAEKDRKAAEAAAAGTTPMEQESAPTGGSAKVRPESAAKEAGAAAGGEQTKTTQPTANGDSSDEGSDGEHRGIVCDKCDKPIRGKRFKCIVCRDFDLCEECEATRPSVGDHDSNHPVLRINRPRDYRGWMRFLVRGLHGMPACPQPPPGFGLHPAGGPPAGFCPPPFAMWGSGRRGHGHHHHKHGGMGKHGWKHGGPPEWANKEAGEQQQQGATNPEQGDQPQNMDESQGQGHGGRGGRRCGRGGPRGGPPGWRRGAWMQWVSDMRQAFENSLDDSGSGQQQQQQQANTGSQQQQQQNGSASDRGYNPEDFLKNVGSHVANVLDAFGIDVEVHTEDSCKTDCPANKKSTTTTTTKSKTTTTNADGTTTTTETPMETTVQQGDKEPSDSAEVVITDMVEGTGPSTDWVMLQPSAPPAPTTVVQPAVAIATTGDQGGASTVVVTGPDGSTTTTTTSSSSSGSGASATIVTNADGEITHGTAVEYPSLPAAEVQDVQIAGALQHMLAMGYTNEGGWLSQLLIAKHGDISAVLDVLAPVNRTPSMRQ